MILMFEPRQHRQWIFIKIAGPGGLQSVISVRRVDSFVGFVPVVCFSWCDQ